MQERYGRLKRSPHARAQNTFCQYIAAIVLLILFGFAFAYFFESVEENT
jgi:hypothetical protein